MSTAVIPAPPGPASVEAGADRRFSIGVLVAAIVTGLLVGYAAGLLTLRPTTPGDTSPEAGFARDMITHHSQAVDMSMTAWQRATDPGVRQLAYDIATAQQGETGMMHQWLREWNLLPTGSEPRMAWMPDGEGAIVNGLMPGMATSEQMAALREAEGTEVDRLFLELMITHHLGGIHMVDGILDVSDHPDVTSLAGTMKATQQGELQVLRNLLSDVSTD